MMLFLDIFNLDDIIQNLNVKCLSYL